MTSQAAQRRAEQKRERREAILDAAERVFGARGAANATMDEVAEAAQVSKGTVYLYFKSKDDLFLALAHRPLDAVLTRFEALLEDDRVSGAVLLRRLIDTHTEVVREHQDRMRLAMASICGDYRPALDTPSLRPYSERIAELRASYHAAIERGMADGTLRPNLEPKKVSGCLWAAMFGAGFIRMNADHFASFVPESESEFEHIGPDLADLLMEAISTPTEAPR